MKLQDVCRQTGITKRNIHFYIKEKLLSPSVNPQNGYYEFSEEDCQKLQFIHEMRNADFSLAAIRSMISNPVSASYYLNQHIKKIKMEQRRLEQTKSSIQYILDELPFFPSFSTLTKLSAEAGIPEKITDKGYSDEFDSYSTTIINLFLWGGFLPEEKLTEYQEFLWMKLNKMTLEHPTEDYKCLGKTLRLIESSLIDKTFAKRNDRYIQIANLTPERLDSFTDDMIIQLKALVNDRKSVRFWNDFYETYYCPSTSIQTSKLSLLMMELSPMYRSYVKNINQVCDRCFSYLNSDEGANLMRELEKAFPGNLNLEANNHGELEALISVPSLCQLINDRQK